MEEHEEKIESENKDVIEHEKVLPNSKKGVIDIKPVLDYIEKHTSKLFSILLIVLLIIFILNISSASVANAILSGKVGPIKEANKPVEIGLTIIDCYDCYEVESITDSIKKQNVKIIDEETLEVDDAQELIAKYNIQKIPSVIITGEIDNERVSFNGFRLEGEALILEDINAPFLDLTTNTLQGKVIIKEIIDSSCEECSSLTSFVDGMVQSGILVESWNKIEYDSAEAQTLISQFSIDKVPTILISDDINHYEGIQETLAQIGTEKDGYHVISLPVPPYRDLNKGSVVGLVDLIILDDNSCSTCYDSSVNKQILTGFGMILQTENTYDISSSEAKALISKYNIQKVPMIILSPGAEEYAAFVNAWTDIGTKESDGWFVMRNPDMLGEIKEI